jgi:hypothetical protein
MQRRDRMIDIHIRVSRKLVLALLLIFVLAIVWTLLQTV